MAWLVIETFILVLIAVVIGVLIGMVLRRSIGAGAGDGGLAMAGADGHGSAFGDHHGDTAETAGPARRVPVDVAAPGSAGEDDVEHAAVAPAGAEVARAQSAATPVATVVADAPTVAAPASGPTATETSGPSAVVEIESTRLTADTSSSAADGIIDAGKAANADQVGVRPPALASARDNRPDDLKRVKGIGPQNESRLNALGIYHFDQIAAWRPEEARWVGTYLAFPGRIEREDWMSQARELSADR